ncbi:hypothetical protein BV25DRAFT_353705 [Artomyces pyxidatus]|uniref:Uncharacterized protein n=1 Tax=Artomyces pyxidatus TaxID=48021 RepID=A0ACB8T637_9AGAM|nr:hypothetical protein BV25DRAFT_353705 [Artomyces pyxidatus]
MHFVVRCRCGRSSRRVTVGHGKAAHKFSKEYSSGVTGASIDYFLLFPLGRARSHVACLRPLYPHDGVAFQIIPRAQLDTLFTPSCAPGSHARLVSGSPSGWTTLPPQVELVSQNLAGCKVELIAGGTSSRTLVFGLGLHIMACLGPVRRRRRRRTHPFGMRRLSRLRLRLP